MSVIFPCVVRGACVMLHVAHAHTSSHTYIYCPTLSQRGIVSCHLSLALAVYCLSVTITAIAQLAAIYEIPFISIRICSNNITNNGVYDLNVAIACQNFAELVAKQYFVEMLTQTS